MNHATSELNPTRPLSGSRSNRAAVIVGTLAVAVAVTCGVKLCMCAGQAVVPRVEDEFIRPKGYVCFRTGASSPAAIAIDGKLDEPAWRAAPWTDDFTDIEGDRQPPPRFRTRAKMLWDNDYFYIAAELDEPHVWGTLTVHDSVIFHDNDFEVFCDPDGDNHNYGEFEINALNTGWDLRLTKPYKDGGKADDGWQTGLKTAIHVSGTLNDPRDTDRGWSIEIAIPWRNLAALYDPSTPVRPARRSGSVFEGYDDDATPSSVNGLRAVPRVRTVATTTLPRNGAEADIYRGAHNGDQWRVNFSRVEWQHRITPDGKYEKVPDTREDNWVWSPQWTINMHRPETWGTVQFSTATAGSDAARAVKFRPDLAGPAKHLLHRAYYAQREFHKQHERFAKSLDELGLSDLRHESLASPLTVASAASRFTVTATVRLPDGSTERWHIREDSRIWKD